MEQTAIDTGAAIEARAAFATDAKPLFDAVEFLRKRICASIDHRNRKSNGREDNRAAIADRIRIDADPRGIITLSACTGWIGAAIELSADVSAPGAVMIGAAQLAKALGKPAKEKREALLSHDGNKLQVKAGRARLAIRTYPLDVSNPMPAGDTLSAEFGLPAEFVADVKAVSPCVADGKTERREHLQAMAFERRELGGRERFVIVACDGSNLAATSRDLPAGAETFESVTLSAEFVPAMIDMQKIAGKGAPVSLRMAKDHNDFRIVELRAGGLRLAMMEHYRPFIDWPQVMGSAASDDAAQASLFPELLPGAPIAAMEAIGRKAGAAIDWEQSGDVMLGTVASDAGRLYVSMRGTADQCGKKGFVYGIHGGGEIIGPDGVSYPVAVKENAAIHLSADQVRALIGESCFETLEFTGPDGAPRYVARWLWDDGATRLLAVKSDGRCPDDGAPREYFTRAEIEAALTGDLTPISETAPDTPSEAIAAVPAEPQERETAIAAPVEPDDAANAPSAPEIAPIAADSGADDAVAALAARIEAIEAAVATLSAQSDAGPSEAIARPKRTAAHERAIRRAWSERKARLDAELHIRIGISQLDAMRQDRDAARADLATAETCTRAAERRERAALDELEQARATAADMQRIAEQHEKAADVAREALCEAQEREQAALIGREDARAQLAKLKRDMADPSQPERASDIARLAQERDQLKNALAAVEARAARLQSGLDQASGAIEAMGLRVAKAESAMRKLGIAA